MKRNEEIPMLAVGQMASRYGVDILLGEAAKEMSRLLSAALKEHDDVTVADHRCDSDCWAVKAQEWIALLRGEKTPSDSLERGAPK